MLTNIKSYQMHDTNHIRLLLSGKHINFIQSIEHSFSQSFQATARSRTQENLFPISFLQPMRNFEFPNLANSEVTVHHYTKVSIIHIPIFLHSYYRSVMTHHTTNKFYNAISCLFFLVLLEVRVDVIKICVNQLCVCHGFPYAWELSRFTWETKTFLLVFCPSHVSNLIQLSDWL